MTAVLYKADPVIIKLSMKMILVISAACLLGSIHASSRGAAVTTARGEVSQVTVGNETYEEILDVNGEPVRYGETYILWAPDLFYGFANTFFGFGGTGVVARTDVQTTLSVVAVFPRTIFTFVCQDNGMLQFVEDPALSLKLMVRVRRNADDTYQLQITDETPPVYAQLTIPNRQCQRGVEGSRVRFELKPFYNLTNVNGGRQSDSSNSTHPAPNLHLVLGLM